MKAPFPLSAKRGRVAFLLLAAFLFGASSAVRAQDEAALITILQSNASAVEKCEACKKLLLSGTAQSVPALSALLTDERVSQAARYALEGNPAPEATTALREALSKTSGTLKGGVVDSLGWKRDEAAVPLLVALLSDTDAVVATSAATTLGRIGGKPATRALTAALAKAPDATRPALADALLRCAERFLAANQTADAQSIYNLLVAGSLPEAVRVAAHVGLIRAAGDHGQTLILSALEGADAAAQTAALQLAGSTNYPNLGSPLVARLLKSPPAMQIALIAVLRQRRELSAQEAIKELATRGDPAVRTAAFTALGDLGDDSAVAVLLAGAVTKDSAQQQSARQALETLRRGDVTKELVSQLRQAAPATQTEIPRALTARGDQSALPALLALARSDSATARAGALRAIGSLADASQLGGLVDLLIATKDAAAREAVVGTFETIAERTPAGQAVDADALVRGLNAPDPDTRLAALQVSALFADEKLRAAFRAALENPNTRLRAGAERALCRTRDAALLPDLLLLAGQTDDPNLRSLAVERVVHLAAETNANLTAALTSTARLATRAEDKRMVLSSLPGVPNATTLKLAQAWLADAAVKAEAELACLQVAEKLGSAEFPTIEPVLKQLAAGASQPSVQGNAQALLRRLDSGWLCAGPYRQAGKQAQDLFDVPFPPEQAGAADIRWQRAPGSADPAHADEVDLGSVTGGDHCVLYLRTQVFAPKAQPVLFLIGTDDGVKLWVNGELVHANNAVRGLTPDQDRASGKLRENWNELRVKVTQHTLGCGMVLRIRHPDGTTISGLRLDPTGGAAQ